MSENGALNFKRIIIALCLSLILLMFLVASTQLSCSLSDNQSVSTSSSTSATQSSSSEWKPTTEYPLPIYLESCATSSGYIYCLGGYSNGSRLNSTYFATISQNGIGAWERSTDYPKKIADESCVTSAGFIYCIGGSVLSGGVNSTYFSPVNSTGIGQWKNTTAYPEPADAISCVTSGAYIYCVGGSYSAISGETFNSTYYAPISSNGIGSWQRSTDYPTTIIEESCVPISSIIYCTTGIVVPPFGAELNETYYAQLNSNGIGAWKETTSYPFKGEYVNCVLDNSSYIYCIGGFEEGVATFNSTYYAPLSPSGIGKWTNGSSYPTPIIEDSCVSESGYAYCIGGVSGNGNTYRSAYYQEMNFPPVTSSQVPSNRSTTLLYSIAVVIVIFAVAIFGAIVIIRRFRRKEVRSFGEPQRAES